jgi:hypothetical protein
LAHLLKRRYIPTPENYRGWENTIDEQREQLQDLLAQSPSLQGYFVEVFEESWQRALKQVKNDYPEINLPTSWPMGHSLETILTEDGWAE